MKKMKLDEIKGHCVAIWEYNGNLFSEPLYRDEDGDLLELYHSGPDAGRPSSSFANPFLLDKCNKVKFFVAGS